MHVDRQIYEHNHKLSLKILHNDLQMRDLKFTRFLACVPLVSLESQKLWNIRIEKTSRESL